VQKQTTKNILMARKISIIFSLIPRFGATTVRDEHLQTYNITHVIKIASVWAIYRNF
jgi:hypothetical protein